MKVIIELLGRKTKVSYNDKSSEHNTVWLKKLTLNDLLLLIEDGNL